MAKDDMQLIVYKVLRYLYDCNRRGKTPTFSDLYAALEMPGVPISYLAQILSNMMDSGYISGCCITATKDATLISVSEDAGITISGTEYLSDNNRMKKAAKVAGRAFEIVLDGVIAAAMSRV